jgi:hypothetical protein
VRTVHNTSFSRVHASAICASLAQFHRLISSFRTLTASHSERLTRDLLSSLAGITCASRARRYWSNDSNVELVTAGITADTHSVERVPSTVLAKGFKVRPQGAWMSERMRSYYISRNVKFLCNTRHDTLKQSVSMYRHPLGREASPYWERMLPLMNAAMKGRDHARVVIPGKLMSPYPDGMTDCSGAATSLGRCVIADADCSVGSAMFKLRFGQLVDNQQPALYLHDCTQNISFATWKRWYWFTDRKMKMVNSICVDYMLAEGASNVHWMNYEATQRAPRQSIAAAVDFLTQFASPERVQRAEAESKEAAVPTVAGSEREKVGTSGGITAMTKMMPNFEEDVVAEWWSNRRCVNGALAGGHNNVSVVVSPYSILSLFFRSDTNELEPPLASRQLPFVALGNDVAWLGNLFAEDQRVMRLAGERGGQHGRTRGGSCHGGCNGSCLTALQAAVWPTSNNSTDSSPPARPLGVVVSSQSLTRWGTPSEDDPAASTVAAMAKAKVRVVCAVWENSIEGGLAALHKRAISNHPLQEMCETHSSDTVLPTQCSEMYTLNPKQLRTAANTVALETFATLRFCREYAKAAGDDAVMVVAHRAGGPVSSDTADHASTLDRLARFLGVPQWSPQRIARHVAGPHHRFFRNVLPALQTVLHEDGRMLCAGCDAFSVADTISLVQKGDK